MRFCETERATLAQLLLELGPDAPTLCEGWTARDLAVHLFIREHRPLAAAGIFLPAFAEKLAREEQVQRERPFEELVADWAKGPKLKALDPVMNTAENFVHLEDLRRGPLLGLGPFGAQGEPRQGIAPRGFSERQERELLKVLGGIAKRTLKSELPVVLEPQGFPRMVLCDRRGVARDGQAVVSVRGRVGEILLWVFGRDVCWVDAHDPAGAVRKRGF